MLERLRSISFHAMESRWFWYGTIFLLQLKIVWGAWQYLDLTSGDTSFYFLDACDWYRGGRVTLGFSMLYTAFYGTLQHLSTDAYVATIAHRLIAVMALPLLVLALMRRLLPAGIAWLMAAWWVALPIDFNALYEAHLFALIPVLAAFLAILAKPGPWGRGWGVAALLVSTVLVRNELLLATLLFGAAALGWDVFRKTPNLVRAYGIPLAAAGLLIAASYSRAKEHSIGELVYAKHTLNICQTYAFGYQQRASDWKGSPWVECEQLMQRVYGQSRVSLGQALRLNPAAMLEHFWWNFKLIPNGLQVLLFNSMSGPVSPDYVPSPYRPLPALLASALALAVVAPGLAILWRDRGYWWKFWLKDRVWAWIAMACVALVVGIVMITQRPRPSYMFALGIALRAVFGMCLFAIASRWPRLKRLSLAMPAFIVALIVAAPCYYMLVNPGGRRPLLAMYRRLAPFERQLQKPDAGLVTLGWTPELCNYLSRSLGCRPLDFRDLSREVSAGTSWDKVLSQRGATVFYADEAVLSDAAGRGFIAGASSYGWQPVALHNEPGKFWAVLEKTSAAAPVSWSVSVPEIVAPGNEVRLGRGWYDLETYPGGLFRWVNNDAELIVAWRDAGPVALLLDVEGGPGLAGKVLALQVFEDGRKLDTVTAPGRQTMHLTLPKGTGTVRLHVDSANATVPHDPRILNFRVFRVSVP